MLLALRETKVTRVIKVTKATRATRATQVLRVHKVLRVIQVQLAQMVHQALTSTMFLTQRLVTSTSGRMASSLSQQISVS